MVNVTGGKGGGAREVLDSSSAAAVSHPEEQRLVGELHNWTGSMLDT